MKSFAFVAAALAAQANAQANSG
jgi:hypothetical protein